MKENSGEKKDDWGDGESAQRSRTGGSKQEWETSVKPTGGEAEPGQKEKKIFSSLPSSSIHVIRSRCFLLQTHPDMHTYIHTHTCTEAHSVFMLPSSGVQEKSQLGTDFSEANARTSTCGRMKQDEAQKPTSSPLWGRADHPV